MLMIMCALRQFFNLCHFHSPLTDRVHIHSESQPSHRILMWKVCKSFVAIVIMLFLFCRAAGAAPYPTAQPGYAVTPAAPAATYPAQRPAPGYETYQTAAAAAPTAYAGVYFNIWAVWHGKFFDLSKIRVPYTNACLVQLMQVLLLHLQHMSTSMEHLLKQHTAQPSNITNSPQQVQHRIPLQKPIIKVSIRPNITCIALAYIRVSSNRENGVKAGTEVMKRW